MHLHSKMIEEICSPKRGVDGRVLEATVMLAVELAREGREGRKIGTLFVVGDSESSMVRVFDDGELIAEIMPELWMLDRFGDDAHLHDPSEARKRSKNDWIQEAAPLMGRLA